MFIQPKTKIIHDFMREHGLGNNEMARKMEINQAFLSRVLRGIQRPGPKFIHSLIRVTGKPFDDLFLVSSLSISNRGEVKKDAV